MVFKEMNLNLTASELMALAPVVDHEVGLQRMHNPSSPIREELEKIQEKIYEAQEGLRD